MNKIKIKTSIFFKQKQILYSSLPLTEAESSI